MAAAVENLTRVASSRWVNARSSDFSATINRARNGSLHSTGIDRRDPGAPFLSGIPMSVGSRSMSGRLSWPSAVVGGSDCSAGDASLAGSVAPAGSASLPCSASPIAGLPTKPAVVMWLISPAELISSKAVYRACASSLAFSTTRLRISPTHPGGAPQALCAGDPADAAWS